MSALTTVLKMSMASFLASAVGGGGESDMPPEKKLIL